jgi:hypothetical protein
MQIHEYDEAYNQIRKLMLKGMCSHKNNICKELEQKQEWKLTSKLHTGEMQIHRFE